MNRQVSKERKNFYLTQNIIHDLNISVQAKQVYCYLSRLSNDEGQSWPSLDTITKCCSISKNTALKSIEKLIEIGLIKRERRVKTKAGRSKNINNLYTIYVTPYKHKLDELLIDKEEGLIEYIIDESENMTKNSNEINSDMNCHSSGYEPIVVQETNYSGSGDEPIVVQETNHSGSGYEPFIVQHMNNRGARNEHNKYRSKNTYYRNIQSINQEENGRLNQDNIRGLVAKNIDYDSLRNKYLYESILEDILEIIVDIMETDKDFIRVNGEEKPSDTVKSEFWKLKSNHIEYVMDSLKTNTTKAKNIRAYMITALYNAPKTMNVYYANLVNHDFANYC